MKLSFVDSFKRVDKTVSQVKLPVNLWINTYLFVGGYVIYYILQTLSSLSFSLFRTGNLRVNTNSL